MSAALTDQLLADDLAEEFGAIEDELCPHGHTDRWACERCCDDERGEFYDTWGDS